MLFKNPIIIFLCLLFDVLVYINIIIPILLLFLLVFADKVV